MIILRRILTRLIGGAALGLCVAAPALAHTTERGFVMLLPTNYYFAGGGLAVAATFLVLLAVPVRKLDSAFAAAWRFERPVLPVGGVLNWLGFLMFAALVVAGLIGARDPLTNPLPIMVWTIWWVGFTLLTAVVGDLWRFINPWTGPYRLLIRVVRIEPRWVLPQWVGYWPAIIGLFGFAWFELVDLAPDDPARLAKVTMAYWIGTFVAMLALGEDTWRRRGETFAVFFGFIARLAPIWGRMSGAARQQVVGVPGARLVRGEALPLSGVLFILLALASVSFDGLNKTFWWLALLGLNPLEFPGRSVVTGANTVGLVAAFVVLSACFFLAVVVGNLLAGGGVSTKTCLGRLVLSIMPIALGYHFSHYLTVLLVNGQYALLAATDPFASGADLLNLGHFHVTTSFLNHRASVERIWQAQAAGIVLAHLFAVLVAHGIAFEIYGSARHAALSQIPLALAMIGYTVFGLWLLATPTGA